MTTNKAEKNTKEFNKKRPIWPTGGIMLIILGIIFLLNNYGLDYINIGKLWPLFLIIVGISILLNFKKK